MREDQPKGMVLVPRWVRAKLKSGDAQFARLRAGAEWGIRPASRNNKGERCFQ
jgi:hypothetical protein